MNQVINRKHNRTEPLVGERVDGRYFLVRPYRHVHKNMWHFFARDEHLERDVLVALINHRQLNTEKACRKFVDRARSLTRMRLPQVQTVLAVGLHNGRPYMVLEWIEGSTLADLLLRHQETPIRPAEVLRILRPLQQAIDGQSSESVRRGLDPTTILLGEGFRVLLTEIELDHLVAAAWESTADSPPPRSPYRPPEQVGTFHSIHQDVYTLSAIAYQLLTGYAPNRPLARASDIVPELATQVDDVLAAGLHADPSKRPDCARKFVSALERALPPVNQTGTLRAIIVDPDLTMQTFLSSILEDNFPELLLECVHDGPTALAAAQRAPVALMITGMHITGMTSLQLAAAVRGLPQGHAAALVLLAVRTGKLDWSRLASIGANAILLKPFHPTDLVQTIRRLYGLAPGDRPSAQGPLTAVPGGLTPVAGRRVHSPTSGVRTVYVSQKPNQVVLWIALLALVVVSAVALERVVQPQKSAAIAPPEVPPAPLAQQVEQPKTVVPKHPQHPAREALVAAVKRADEADELVDESPKPNKPRTAKPSRSSKAQGEAAGQDPPENEPDADADTSSESLDDQSDTPRCQRITETAQEGMKLHDWNGVLRQLAKTECWPNVQERQRLRTKALMELGKFAECVEVGRSHPSAEVKEWVALCEKRGAG